MSNKKAVRDKLVAKLVGDDEKTPCVFCGRQENDEIIYGKLYAIGDIQCHYFCVLLSCCLVQKGKDEDGLLGFLYKDIVAEVERSKKHRCSYCHKIGATLGCAVTQCRKQFHLPCGREKRCISLFYNDYKSYCEDHAPKQIVPPNIMGKVKLRRKADARKKRAHRTVMLEAESGLDSSLDRSVSDAGEEEDECVCVICYESVSGYPSTVTFWPPCCARDAWFHRSCLQRMALSAGMYYLKCPLCNDKKNFYKAVISQGYYVPDRDAAWELERNAFADIYTRPERCMAADCRCPFGPAHDADGLWDIKICLLCGSVAMHSYCIQEMKSQSPKRDSVLNGGAGRYVCSTCAPAAPEDLDALETNIAKVILLEQSREEHGPRRGPVMPSRMSLRRTKRLLQATGSGWSDTQQRQSIATDRASNRDRTIGASNTQSSRDTLNLKPPRRLPPPSLRTTSVLQNIENTACSPRKLLENHIMEKIASARRMGIHDTEDIVETIQAEMRKPKPLCVKKNVIDKLLNQILKRTVCTKEDSQELSEKLCSPIQVCDNQSDLTQISSAENEGKENIIISTNNHEATSEENVEWLEEEILENAEPDNVTDLTIAGAEIDISNGSSKRKPGESLMIHETPKKLKTIDIEKECTTEILADNETVNVDLVAVENVDITKSLSAKTPKKTKKCVVLKFSPLDKETLQKNKIDIDLESFKNHYLNEVDKVSKCNFNDNLQVASEFTEDAMTKNYMESDNEEQTKELDHMNTEIKLRTEENENDLCRRPALESKLRNIETITKKKMLRKMKKNKRKHNVNKNSILSDDTSSKVVNIKISSQKNQSEHKSRRCLKSENLKANIVLKSKQSGFHLKINIKDQKIKRKRIFKILKRSRNTVEERKTLKQYVLNYSPENCSSKSVIVKPTNDITPLKKKHIKAERSPGGKFVQTSIQNFFTQQIPKHEKD